MQSITASFEVAKRAYDKANASPLERLGELAVVSLEKLEAVQYLSVEAIAGRKGEQRLQKDYCIARFADKLSRPILADLFIRNAADFAVAWSSFSAAIDPLNVTVRLSSAEIHRALYTASTSLSVAYDLWNPGSRKTPGTHFEVLMGSVLGRLLPSYKRTAHIPLISDDDAAATSEDSLSTDIVLTDPAQRAPLVFPAKITTRERIVQCFAHQRILHSCMPSKNFRSLLLCVSEMQREKDRRANEICIPRVIGLYQKHLAELDGIFYLDPPYGYLRDELKSIIHVGSLGDLLTSGLAAYVDRTDPRHGVASALDARPQDDFPRRPRGRKAP